MIIIDAPPYAGKTSLVKLVSALLSKHKRKFVPLSWLHKRPHDEVEDRKAHWEKELEPKMRIVLSKRTHDLVYTSCQEEPDEEVYIISDETQKSYELGADHQFWRIIKDCQQKSTGIFWILFSSWGSTPLPGEITLPTSVLDSISGGFDLCQVLLVHQSLFNVDCTSRTSVSHQENSMI